MFVAQHVCAYAFHRTDKNIAPIRRSDKGATPTAPLGPHSSASSPVISHGWPARHPLPVLIAVPASTRGVQFRSYYWTPIFLVLVVLRRPTVETYMQEEGLEKVHRKLPLLGSTGHLEDLIALRSSRTALALHVDEGRFVDGITTRSDMCAAPMTWGEPH